MLCLVHGDRLGLDHAATSTLRCSLNLLDSGVPTLDDCACRRPLRGFLDLGHRYRLLLLDSNLPDCLECPLTCPERRRLDLFDGHLLLLNQCPLSRPNRSRLDLFYRHLGSLVDRDTPFNCAGSGPCCSGLDSLDSNLLALFGGQRVIPLECAVDRSLCGFLNRADFRLTGYSGLIGCTRGCATGCYLHSLLGLRLHLLVFTCNSL